MEFIKLSDYLFHECRLKGCKHNDSKGCCYNTDLDFLEKVIDNIRYAIGYNGDFDYSREFVCIYAEAHDGYCLRCGNELNIYRDFQDIDGRSYYQNFVKCPVCIDNQ